MRGEKATQMLGEETLEHGGHAVVVRPTCCLTSAR